MKIEFSLENKNFLIWFSNCCKVKADQKYFETSECFPVLWSDLGNSLPPCLVSWIIHSDPDIHLHANVTQQHPKIKRDRIIFHSWCRWRMSLSLSYLGTWVGVVSLSIFLNAATNNSQWSRTGNRDLIPVLEQYSTFETREISMVIIDPRFSTRHRKRIKLEWFLDVSPFDEVLALKEFPMLGVSWKMFHGKWKTIARIFQRFSLKFESVLVASSLAQHRFACQSKDFLLK